jgi:pimeloyl-ACP methyl ester carboxylesterase
MHPQPPRRTTHATGGPRNLLVYDRWGQYGRPVLLLHGLFFDRTMWWPVAAELTGPCTVVAPDLPGHGDSPLRADHDLPRLARDLAVLVDRLELHRAPVVVGHATSAPLAVAFAEAFATHHVLTIDEPGPAVADLGDVLTAVSLSEVPGHYRPYARPRCDGALLRAYAGWLENPPSRRNALAEPIGAGRAASRAPDLAGSFPHLADPGRFADGLRALL